MPPLFAKATRILTDCLAMMDDILLDRQKLTGNIFFEVTPIKNLVWHAELGYDISSSKGERYKPMVDLGGWVRSSNESNNPEKTAVHSGN